MMPNNTELLRIEAPYDPEKIYVLRPFDRMILSFCADTPRGTAIEVYARVRVNGSFGAWFSWGVWSPFVDRHSCSSEDENAKLDTDTLIVRNGQLADAVQVRVTIHGGEGEEAPCVRRIVLACKNTKIQSDEVLTFEKDVYVRTPSYSQRVRDPKIGGVICSATTIAMQLAQKGESVLPEEIALSNYDSAYDGCGNWSFSTAIAATYGYDAYVQYCTLADVASEIERGNAVGASVAYTNDENEKRYPYLENSPCTTAGHLLVVCGFKTDENGKKWVVVHDPAAYSNDTVERLYPLNQFLQAWDNRVCYIVHREEKGVSRHIPEHRTMSLSTSPKEVAWELLSEEGRVVLGRDGSFRNTVACWVTNKKGDKYADCDFAYGAVTQEGNLVLDTYEGEKLFVITNRGVIYEMN